MKSEWENSIILDSETSGSVDILKLSQFKDDGYTCLDFYTPNFYSLQGSFWYKFWRAIKLSFFILVGKEYCLHSISIENNDTLNNFKKFVSEMREIEDGN